MDRNVDEARSLEGAKKRFREAKDWEVVLGNSTRFLTSSRDQIKFVRPFLRAIYANFDSLSKKPRWFNFLRAMSSAVSQCQILLELLKNEGGTVDQKIARIIYGSSSLPSSFQSLLIFIVSRCPPVSLGTDLSIGGLQNL